MINLFENYDSNTRELHESLKIAGYHPFTIVLNDDGFLPDEVTSPYQYFADYQIYDDDKPAFFNDVTTPPFWEIKGNGTMAQVIDMGELRGKIFYKENYKTRVVSYVEWLDKHQRLR
ncbi:accessory Sec system glycosyltransferase GtfB [Staphylococcus capitis]